MTDIRAYAKIVRKGKSPNLFIILTNKGSVLCRNRWHLVPAPLSKTTKANNYPKLTEPNNMQELEKSDNWEDDKPIVEGNTESEQVRKMICSKSKT